MRDISVADVNFTNADNETITIKDMREYTPYDIQGKYITQKGEDLDLIAKKVYGDDSEFLNYKIFDQNVVKILNSGFNLDKIKELEIPN